MNNIPTMLSRDNFQAQHRDMLVSACCEPLSKEEIEARRKPSISMGNVIEWDLGGQDKSMFWIIGKGGKILTDADAEAEYLKRLQAAAEEYRKTPCELWAGAKIGDKFRVRFPSKDWCRL